MPVGTTPTPLCLLHVLAFPPARGQLPQDLRGRSPPQLHAAGVGRALLHHGLRACCWGARTRSLLQMSRVGWAPGCAGKLDYTCSLLEPWGAEASPGN